MGGKLLEANAPGTGAPPPSKIEKRVFLACLLTAGGALWSVSRLVSSIPLEETEVRYFRERRALRDVMAPRRFFRMAAFGASFPYDEERVLPGLSTPLRAEIAEQRNTMNKYLLSGDGFNLVELALFEQDPAHFYKDATGVRMELTIYLDKLNVARAKLGKARLTKSEAMSRLTDGMNQYWETLEAFIDTRTPTERADLDRRRWRKSARTMEHYRGWDNAKPPMGQPAIRKVLLALVTQ